MYIIKPVGREVLDRWIYPYINTTFKIPKKELSPRTSSIGIMPVKDGYAFEDVTNIRFRFSVLLHKPLPES